MTKKFISVVLILFIFCMPVYAVKLQCKSMLELRKLQTRYFDTGNRKLVMKAVINTLQDNGFVIQNLEDELGYLRAKKEFRTECTECKRIVYYSLEFVYYLITTFGILTPIAMMHMSNELELHPVIVDCNVSFESVGKRTKVRFVFVEKIYENADGFTYVKSTPKKIIRYYTPEIYQEFFNQLDKNIFIEES